MTDLQEFSSSNNIAALRGNTNNDDNGNGNGNSDDDVGIDSSMQARIAAMKTNLTAGAVSSQ